MLDERKGGALPRQASEQASRITERAEATVDRTRELMREAADKIGETAHDTVGRVQSSAAAASERLRKDFAGIRGEVETLVRRHPIEAVLIGVALGYLVARGARG